MIGWLIDQVCRQLLGCSAGAPRVRWWWWWVGGAAERSTLAAQPALLTRGLPSLPPWAQRLSADQHQAVADALAVNIRALLAALPPPARVAQLAFLAHMHPEDGSSCGQWRMRLLIAEQLGGIAALLERQALAEVLLPATLRLCEDPVAAVREAAAAQLGCMVGSLLAEMGGRGSRGGSASPEQRAAPQPGADPEGPPVAGGSSAVVQKQQQKQEPSSQQEQQPQEQQQQQPADEEEEEEDELGHVAVQLPGGPAAMVQQIVQHLVELRRSPCHRSRQTYLIFCAALLLPQPAPQPAKPAAEQQPAGGSAAAGAEEGAEGAAAVPGQAAGAAASPDEAVAAREEAGSTAADPSWPQLPDAVAQSGIAQGLLEGAVALASDPVPNVRLAVARMLAALRQQQPALAGSNPHVGEALAALAADADRDVQTAAAGGC